MPLSLSVDRMPRILLNLDDVRPVWSMPDWALREIRAAVPEHWECVVVEGAADGRGDGGAPPLEVLQGIQDAEIYMGYGFPQPLFAAAHRNGTPRLRWVHSAAAGVGSALYPEMRASAVVLTNSAGIHAAPMAETVLSMILYFARGLDFAAAAQRDRRWGNDAFEAADTPVREIAGSTLGIVGFGGIGREVAVRASALGMNVLALKRTPGEVPQGVELLGGENGLGELLRRSDFVVLAVPETSSTRGLIGAAELQAMRPGAVLVNVARGGVLDEDALVESIRTGHLRGAALDVFQQEPLPLESPLWDLPGVLITPHVSATTRGFWRRQTDLIVENLRRYFDGRPLLNEVDKQAGY